MRISLDFELEYDLENADQALKLRDAILAVVFVAKLATPEVTIPKITTRTVLASPVHAEL